MIGFHKRASIRQKIIAISTLTSGIVLTVAATTMLLSDFYKERSAIVETTSMLADLVEINVGAALVFRDPEAATEVLSELKAVPDVAAAYIYSDEGGLFAKYISEKPQHQNLQTQTLDDGYPVYIEREKCAPHFSYNCCKCISACPFINGNYEKIKAKHLKRNP